MNDQTTAKQAVSSSPGPANEARATLVLHHGDTATVTPMQTGAALTVGRQSPSDLLVDDPGLSRQHARFRVSGQEVTVEDLGSRNGTIVGGRRRRRAQLQSGEPVRMGSVIAAVHVMAAPARPHGTHDADVPVVCSQEMVDLYERVDQVATTTVPVLILGETGTGKELVAQALHGRSQRARQPMRVINCAAIPDGIAESLLFGHERGAFTGAHASRPGLFEQADGGTLFLDEVGELSLANQAALLRTLESRMVHPVGSRRSVEVDVRVVAATHRDLPSSIAQGRFREDLYYRLNTMTLRVPPLRERPEEIAPLARHFLERASATWDRPRRELSAEACAHIRSLPWPGNIRQLRNAMDHATLVCRGEMIEPSDLPADLGDSHQDPSQGGQRVVEGSVETTGGRRSRGTLAPPCGSPDDGLSLKERVREYQARLIIDALRTSGGNRREAARLLAIPVRTLAHKMNAYGIRARMQRDRA